MQFYYADHVDEFFMYPVYNHVDITYWLKKGMLHVFIPQTLDPFHKPCSTSANEDMFPADLDEIH